MTKELKKLACWDRLSLAEKGDLAFFVSALLAKVDKIREETIVAETCLKATEILSKYALETKTTEELDRIENAQREILAYFPTYSRDMNKEQDTTHDWEERWDKFFSWLIGGQMLLHPDREKLIRERLENDFIKQLLEEKVEKIRRRHQDIASIPQREPGLGAYLIALEDTITLLTSNNKET